MKKTIITLSGEHIDESIIPGVQKSKKEKPDEFAFAVEGFRDPLRRYVNFRRKHYRRLGRDGKKSLFDIYCALWEISGGCPDEADRLVNIHIREGFHSLRLHHVTGRGENFRIIEIAQPLKKQMI